MEAVLQLGLFWIGASLIAIQVIMFAIAAGEAKYARRAGNDWSVTFPAWPLFLGALLIVAAWFV